jgi:hypothetical protein
MGGAVIVRTARSLLSRVGGRGRREHPPLSYIHLNACRFLFLLSPFCWGSLFRYKKATQELYSTVKFFAKTLKNCKSCSDFHIIVMTSFAFFVKNLRKVNIWSFLRQFYGKIFRKIFVIFVHICKWFLWKNLFCANVCENVKTPIFVSTLAVQCSPTNIEEGRAASKSPH